MNGVVVVLEFSVVVFFSVSWEGIYKVLSEDGNLSFVIVVKIVYALGLWIVFELVWFMV